MVITNRQKEIIDFIREFQHRQGFPPSLREICKALGLTSPGSMIKHMRSLESEGFIRRIPGKKRAWSLIGLSSRICIPLIGRIAAGTPILAEENREDDLPVDPGLFGSKEAFALRVSGDSMVDAQIRDGDLAIIRPQDDAENGWIVAVLVQGLETEATLKIFRRKNEEIELHAANPAYEPVVFKKEEQSRVKILGKLIGIIRPKP
ncbi:MAG: transcriptional repressor LexA [Desulfomonile sp.]|jgi:repressor LexA|nr:transcriptional repressor LexA [Deltaproteobacteria bacterium]